MMVPKFEGYSSNDDGLLIFNERIYVPANDELRSLISSEAHRALYINHLRVKNMK
jgi:hypothetical protein